MDHSTTQSVTTLPAIAVSEDSKLFISLLPSDQPGSIQPDSPDASVLSTKETLTFFGDYTESEDHKDDSKTDLDKAKSTAIGVLITTGALFAEDDFARFKATKVKNIIDHNFDVTISIYGYRKVGTQNVAISAEFKGLGDIRVGEGAGVWHMAVKNPNM